MLMVEDERDSFMLQSAIADEMWTSKCALDDPLSDESF